MSRWVLVKNRYPQPGHHRGLLGSREIESHQSRTNFSNKEPPYLAREGRLLWLRSNVNKPIDPHLGIWNYEFSVGLSVELRNSEFLHSGLWNWSKLGNSRIFPTMRRRGVWNFLVAYREASLNVSFATWHCGFEEFCSPLGIELGIIRVAKSALRLGPKVNSGRTPPRATRGYMAAALRNLLLIIWRKQWLRPN